MNTTDSAIRAHLAAAADLVQLALADARAEDPDGAEGIAHAMKSGAMLTLNTTVSAAGLAFLSIHLTAANGESLGQLMSVELRREAGR